MLYKKRPLWAFIENGLLTLSLNLKEPFIGLYRPSSKMAFIEDFLPYCFIEYGLYGGFFILSLYKKRSLLAFIENILFCFVALLLYPKRPLSKRAFFTFITLSKTAFIKDFSIYYFIKNGLYRPLLKLHFSLHYFIEKSIYWLFSL